MFACFAYLCIFVCCVLLLVVCVYVLETIRGEGRIWHLVGSDIVLREVSSVGIWRCYFFFSEGRRLKSFALVSWARSGV